ncbi:protein of unknown function [Chitinophaga costaii]|uniref:DUF4252 domain-containing protein n=1 Tax=Chitinophaga costaii TaxID=1335309 RepID=A0A1C4FDH4_9BACT|nr:DUF4252 domain-containing protein [Chitinophaga costaii]PUZ20653.1 DUF4252 domain-containing protein [Chitinophaga costaii]SCC54049.1 protein of unknown function [Chitinophaga costaii]
MKRTLLYCSIAVILGLLAVLPAIAQKKSLRAFCQEYRGQAEIHTFGVGRPLLTLASWIIPAKDEDTRMAKHLLRKLRHVKLYTITVDSNANVSNGSMERLKSRLEAEHYESLTDIRSDGSIVHVMSNGRAENLGNVVLLVKDDKDIVFISLRTRLTLKDVSDVVNHYALTDLHKKHIAEKRTQDSSALPAATTFTAGSIAKDK